MNKFEKGLLKYFTKKQLVSIRKTKIGIAGCGGIGSNVANALARSGFRDFEVIDPDTIEPSNLNRQNYFIDEIGQPKTKTLSKRLKKINPDIRIKNINRYLNKKNIINIFKDRDIIFEAFDNIESKKLLLEAFGNSKKLIIMCSGMAGIGNQNNIKIRKVKKNVFIVGDEQTDVGKKNPPLAPRVIACAGLMASVALEKVLKG